MRVKTEVYLECGIDSRRAVICVVVILDRNFTSWLTFDGEHIHLYHYRDSRTLHVIGRYPCHRHSWFYLVVVAVGLK